MTLRLAVVVSHPIQYFAPLHREVAGRGEVDLRVFFCCDWGVRDYTDPEFARAVRWDVPLLDGYAHEFLPIARRPDRLTFATVDNPSVGEALDRFDPDAVQIFGYAYRTNWRVVAWARRRRKPVLISSDSNAAARRGVLRRAAKELVVRRFYRGLSGALYIGENNRRYHASYGMPDERLFPSVLPVDRRRLLAAVPDREAARREVRERHGIPEDAFVAILCGKYIAHKRPLDLIRAAAEGTRRGRPVWAMLVGEGPERPVLEEHCRTNGLANVALTGFVNQSEIAKYYAAADVVTLTSSREAFGVAITEGATFGLPVVVSDQVGCIGPNDVARPGANAIVFPCGDVGSLADTLALLHDDRAAYARMSAESARVAETQDTPVAAVALAVAARGVVRLGPRRT